MTNDLPRRLGRTTVYDSPWVTLHLDRVRLPTGRIIDAHHVLDFRVPSSAAVVIDGAGRILMVRAYRYVTGRSQWELPAGRGEKGESPARTAAREVFEETGYRTRSHRLLYSYFPMNGIANQVFNVVACRAGRRDGAFDPHEVAAVRWFTRTEVERLIARNQMRDGFSLVGVLVYLAGFGRKITKRRGRLRPSPRALARPSAGTRRSTRRSARRRPE